MDLLRRSEILRWHLIMIHFCLIIHPFSASEPSTVQAVLSRHRGDGFGIIQCCDDRDGNRDFDEQSGCGSLAVLPRHPLLIHRLGSLPEALTHRRGNNAQKKVEIIYSWYISFGYALQLYLFPCVSRDFASCRLKFNTYVRKLCIICWRGHTEDLAKHCLRGKVAYLPCITLH